MAIKSLCGNESRICSAMSMQVLELCTEIEQFLGRGEEKRGFYRGEGSEKEEEMSEKDLPIWNGLL